MHPAPAGFFFILPMTRKKIFNDGQISIPFTDIHMKMILDRPIVFFDIESTGLNTGTDRIVEIALLKVQPDGTTRTMVHRINPLMKIPEEAVRIHGITDQDVAGKPSFEKLAGEIAAFIRDCDLGGYNSDKFDIPILAEEFARVGYDIDLKKTRFVDVQAIFFKKEPRNLAAAYKFYCNAELTDAHSAKADVDATWEILQAQLDRYPDLEPRVESLAAMGQASRFVDFAGRIILSDNGQEVFNFGRYKGNPVMEVFRKDPQYYDWMMNGDFPEYTKRVITRIYLKLRNL
jgi:DNA polymerase-3 subunit epsilon